MNWESRYLPPDPTVWQGRIDIPADSCFYQHMRMLNLLTEKPQKITIKLALHSLVSNVMKVCNVILVEPAHLKARSRFVSASRKLPIQKPALHCYDAGNVICTDHDLEASQKALARSHAKLLAQKIIPIVIGGGHEVAWGHYQGISKVYPPERHLGIINFDAHFDMHPMHPVTSRQLHNHFLSNC